MSKVAHIQFASTGAVHGMTDGVARFDYDDYHYHDPKAGR